MKHVGPINSPCKKPSEINPEIEFLRAFAILIVAFMHSNQLVPGGDRIHRIFFQVFTGWAGVDLFFCVSGFVISKSLTGLFDLNRDRWATATQAFWVRRFFRIAPTGLFWMLFSLVFAILLNKSGAFHTIIENLQSDAAILSYTANLVSPFNLGPNAVFWSLALEEQFYLVYPFFLLFVPIAWRWRVFLCLIALQAFPDRSQLGHSLMWCTRLDAIMWGCIVYQFTRSAAYRIWEPVFCRKPWAALSINALLFVLIMATPVLLAQLQVASLVAVFSAILVFLASYSKGYVLPIPSAIKTVLLWIGSRSYAIYMTHIPMMALTKELWLRYTILLKTSPPDNSYELRFYITWLCLSLVSAELNFRLLERPLRRRGNKIAADLMMSPLSPERSGRSDGLTVGQPERPGHLGGLTVSH